MASFQVVQSEVAGELEAKDDRPRLNIVHLTLNQNGQQVQAIRFMRPTTPLPKVGETVEGELGEQDSRSGRRKFKSSFQSQGGSQSFKPDPERSRRIERQHSQHMALLYVQAKGKQDFSFADVVKLTDAFEKDLNGPTAQSEVPFDSTNLANEVEF